MKNNQAVYQMSATGEMVRIPLKKLSRWDENKLHPSLAIDEVETLKNDLKRLAGIK